MDVQDSQGQRYQAVNNTSVVFDQYVFDPGEQTLMPSNREQAQLFDTRAIALSHAM